MVNLQPGLKVNKMIVNTFDKQL